MRGVLPDPSPSLTVSPICDGLDVTVTSINGLSWFHPNHDMVSRRIYRLSIYGEAVRVPPFAPLLNSRLTSL